MGLRKKSLPVWCWGILILEDILAIVLMVMPFNWRFENNFRRVGNVRHGIGKLLFFWFFGLLWASIHSSVSETVANSNQETLADCFLGFVFRHGDASGAYRFFGGIRCFYHGIYFGPKRWRLSLYLSPGTNRWICLALYFRIGRNDGFNPAMIVEYAVPYLVTPLVVVADSHLRHLWRCVGRTAIETA